MGKLVTNFGYSTTWTNDHITYKVPNNWKFDGTQAPAVLYFHGRGGDSAHQWTNPAMHMQALVEQLGMPVIGADLTGPNAYGHPALMNLATDIYNFAKNVIKMKGTQVYGEAWSMGGPALLGWARRNPTLIKKIRMWSPLLDMDWFHQTGGYTPPYTPGYTWASVGIPTNTEIDTAYTTVGTAGAVSTTATASVTVPASGGAGVAVTLATTVNFGDPTTRSTDARLQQATIGGVVCTYTGVSATQLTGVVSTTASTVAVVNGTVVSTNYAQNVSGYDPMKTPAAWGPTGLNVPIKIIHASDDVTVPPAATAYWAAQVGANVTVRSPAPTGGHSGQWFNVPISETVNDYST